MLAYDYPLLGFFWSMLILFIWIAWIFLLIRVFADIFRNHQMGGVAKAIWTIFVVIVPFLGVLIYLIVHGSDMGKRDLEQAQAQHDAFEAYVRQTAGTPSAVASADELTKLAALRDQGVLTDAEFAAQKAKLLG